MLQSDVYKIIGVGIEHGTLRAYDIRNTNDEVSFRVDIGGNAEPFRFSVPGKHNVINCMSAVAIGLKYGLTPDQIRSGLDAYKPSKNRMEIITQNGITFINDTYNANPDSMKAAVDVLCHIAGQEEKLPYCVICMSWGNVHRKCMVSAGNSRRKRR
jgi:UDP-N-acetylmuramoyl-tripeptide--D-alanyl-D-alanine ligase